MIPMPWHEVIDADWKKDKMEMKIVDGKPILLGFKDGNWFATEALCRHMRWPLAWGGKVTDENCIRCPLHQTTHNLETGELVDWAPFPIFPPYGKLVGKMSKKKDLKIYQTKVEEGKIWVNLP